nr:methionine synthase [Desulfitobacterium hafniense]
MKSLFEQELGKKILILDGAMGTMLQRANLTAEDFGGSEFEGCNELLNITRPELIQSIHEIYLEAGADIIETNTFGGTSIVLADYGVESRDTELNIAGAKIARVAADSFSTTEKPRFVAGSIGPTNKMLSLTGGITFDEMAEAYYRQVIGLIEGGVDLLLVETSQDTLNAKAAGVGILRAFREKGVELPIMISGTIEATGTTLAGQSIEAFYVSLEHLKPVTVGLNCATGPEFMRDHVRTLSQLAQCGLSCYPNAGLPDENGNYLESPREFAAKLKSFAEEGWVNVVGGCCGTTPEHIKELADALRNAVPRTPSREGFSAVSGIEPVFVEDENRPILVGERTNVIGSRKFRDLIANGSYDEASDIARAQTKKGAQVIDVCLANPDRDEYEDMTIFLPYVVKKVKAPLMIDSTDPKVMELGLKHSQGKSILNSVNLEEGSRRLDEVIPLVKQYGSALVVGTIDEKGMALTRERKLEVAKRAYALLVSQGIKPNDIIFDPLTFPVGTGDEQYLGSAVETIEGIRLIKQEFPEVKTILGVSNVSFGLPQAGREVLNAVFLYHATKAGLDYAIVNAEKLERYASISGEEKILAEKILFETGEESVSRFAEFYRNKTTVKQAKTQALTLEERLSNYVVEGSKDGLKKDIAEALSKYKPLEIINGPLMTGMEEVGRLFNGNQLIVAEVLQSAEVMKAAVSYLEPYLEKSESTVKGKVLLATVKGDVHDIGKNLLEIILSNNGYDVVNLGIKVSPEQIIDACRKEEPDAVGLSGLLVKSAHQMVVTAQDLASAGIAVPLLVGGAALTKKFTETKIATAYKGSVYYAKDAMNGLELVNRLSVLSKRDGKVDAEHASPKVNQAGAANALIEGSESGNPDNPSNVDRNVPIAVPADLERHLLKEYPLTELWPYVNLRMLLGRHLGVKG